MKSLQRLPELHNINSRVKDAASLEDLDATITDDFIAALFSMASLLTIVLGPSCGWRWAWFSTFLCLHGRREPGWCWQSVVRKVTPLTGTRPVALPTPSTGQRLRSVGALMAARITYCFSYFRMHKPDIPLYNI